MFNAPQPIFINNKFSHRDYYMNPGFPNQNDIFVKRHYFFVNWGPKAVV